MSNTDVPVLSIITVGLCPSEIVTTLQPLINTLTDPRVELVVVTSFDNIDCVSQSIPAIYVPDQGDGVYQAMNLGISASTGDYLWFLNAGDKPLMSSASFYSLLGSLSRQRLNVVVSELYFFGFQPFAANRPWFHSLFITFLKLLVLFSIMPVSHQNILFLRSCHRPFSLRYKYSCDFEILADLILAAKCDIIFASSKPIAELSAGGMSDTNRLSVFRERLAILSAVSSNYLAPIILLGFLSRSIREAFASTVKILINKP